MGDHRLYVRFPDGEIRHGGYRSSCDLALPALFETPDEAAQAAFIRGRVVPDHGTGEQVEVATVYGNGFWWTATALKDWLTSNHDPFAADEHAGLPEWLTAYFADDDADE